MHMLISVTFSLPPGVWGLAAASACGSSWTFLFTFLFLFCVTLSFNILRARHVLTFSCAPCSRVSFEHCDHLA